MEAKVLSESLTVKCNGLLIVVLNIIIENVFIDERNYFIGPYFRSLNLPQ